MASTITYATMQAYKDFLLATHPELLHTYVLLVDAIAVLQAKYLVVSLQDLDGKTTFGTISYELEGEAFNVAFRQCSAFIMKAPDWLPKDDRIIITVEKTVEDLVWFIQRPYSANKPL